MINDEVYDIEYTEVNGEGGGDIDWSVANRMM